MGAIRIETSEGAQAINIMLLCLSIEKTLKSFMAGNPLSREERVVIKEARKLFSQVVMGSLTTTFEELRASSSLLPPDQIDLFESFTPFEYACNLLGDEHMAVTFSLENALLLMTIEDEKDFSLERFSSEKLKHFVGGKRDAIKNCQDFFVNMWFHIDEQIVGVES